MMRTLLVTAAITMAVASARADVIYAGTAFPEVSVTNANSEMGGFNRIGFGDEYSSLGTRVSLTETMLITGIHGVGNTD